jgi:hypothetical protein
MQPKRFVEFYLLSFEVNLKGHDHENDWLFVDMLEKM